MGRSHLITDAKLNISRQIVAGATPLRLFGYNPSSAVGNAETVWTGSTLYPWSAWDSSSPATLWVGSSDGADTGPVQLNGIDANGNAISEIVVLQGTTYVQTSLSYHRLNSMIYLGDSSGRNTGNITARLGSGAGTMVQHIAADLGQSLAAIYTVPVKTTLYVYSVDFSCAKSSGASVRVWARPHDQVFRVASVAEVWEGSYSQQFLVPIPVPARFDLDFIASNVESSNSRVAVNLTGVLVRDGY